MTVHRGTMDVRNRNFSSETLSWEAASTGAAGGASSTQVSVSSLAVSTGFVKQAGFAVNSSNELLTVGASGSTTVNVSSLAGKVLVDQNSTVWAVQADGRVRAQNSTIGDLLASVQQNSTVWQVQAGSTNWPKAAGLSVDSSNTQNVKLDGSTAITIGSIAANAGRVNIGSTAGDNQVQTTPTAGTTQATRPLQSSAADLQMTATIGGNLQSTIVPLAGSSGLMVRQIGPHGVTNSSASDLKVSAFLFDSTGNALLTSSDMANASTKSGLVVRQPSLDPALSTSISNVKANGSSATVTLVSSVAAKTVFCYGYQVTTLNSTAAALGATSTSVTMTVLSGAVELWRFTLASGGDGPFALALSVAPPQYLFKTAAAAAMTLNNAASTGLPIHYSFALWQE